jgi:hypothetical protein
MAPHRRFYLTLRKVSMALSNTERQKQFRERSKAAKTALGLDGLRRDVPLERSRALLALMIEVMQRGSVKQIADDDVGGVTIKIEAPLDDLPKEAQQGLLSACEWIPEPTIHLWEEGYPVRFDVSIKPVVDNREATALQQRIEMRRWLRRPPPPR